MGCVASLVGRALRDEEQTLANAVAWPLTTFGTAALTLKIAVLLAAVVLGSLVCQQSDTCSGRAWDEDFWGEREESDEYCERFNPDAYMQERANTLSNLAFVASGLYIMGCGFADAMRQGSLTPLRRTGSAAPRQNHVMCFPMLSQVLGLAVVLQGVFSYFFHAHATRLTQHLDVGIMSVILTTLTAAAFMLCADPNGPHLARTQCIVLGGWTVIGVTLFVLKWEVSATLLSLTLIALNGLGIGVAVLRRSGSPRVACARRIVCAPAPGAAHSQMRFRRASLLLAAVATFGLAFGVRAHGTSKKSCAPDSIFQYHAGWHVLAAAATLMQYLFLRSERSTFVAAEKSASTVAGML